MSDDDDFIAALDALDDRITAAIPAILAKAMEHVRTVSTELAPIREGNLRNSAGVTVEGDEAQLYYPGPYARRQHFELDWHHTRGQALYLEQPMITEAPTVMEIIAEGIGDVV